jgi:hypothetical protein
MLKSRAYDEWIAAGAPPSGERPREGETIGVNRRPWGTVEIPRWASFMLTPWFEGEVELGPMWAGESVELVKAIRPAGEVVAAIAAEADEILATLPKPTTVRPSAS